jgi:hypothetical protein
MIGHKVYHRSYAIVIYFTIGRGAFYIRRRMTARFSGGYRKANVGMSNDKIGEKPIRRKTKGSWFDVNQNRVSRDLRRTRRGKSMENG